MPTRFQKQQGLDTVKVVDVKDGYATLFNNMLTIIAEDTESKSVQEAFEEVTRLIALHYLGPEEVNRTIWYNTGDHMDFK